MDTLFENAVPNVFALGAFSILCLVLLGSRLVKRDSLSHVPIYEVSREGKHERQYPSLSKAVHAAFPKVTKPLHYALQEAHFGLVPQWHFQADGDMGGLGRRAS